MQYALFADKPTVIDGLHINQSIEFRSTLSIKNSLVTSPISAKIIDVFTKTKVESSIICNNSNLVITDCSIENLTLRRVKEEHINDSDLQKLITQIQTLRDKKEIQLDQNKIILLEQSPFGFGKSTLSSPQGLITVEYNNGTRAEFYQYKAPLAQNFTLNLKTEKFCLITNSEKELLTAIERIQNFEIEKIALQLQELFEKKCILLGSNKIIMNVKKEGYSGEPSVSGGYLVRIESYGNPIHISITKTSYSLKTDLFTLIAKNEAEVSAAIDIAMEKISVNALIPLLKELRNKSLIYIEKNKILVEQKSKYGNGIMAPPLKSIGFQYRDGTKIDYYEDILHPTVLLQMDTFTIQAPCEKYLLKAIDQILEQEPQLVTLRDCHVKCLTFESKGQVKLLGNSTVETLKDGAVQNNN